ncbi:MAG: hypothetical protein U0869_01055 [Chloroflexota bacterium]
MASTSSVVTPVPVGSDRTSAAARSVTGSSTSGRSLRYGSRRWQPGAK